MEKETKFVSLFDYLGRAAGGELGKAVYIASIKANQPVQERTISNAKYSGKVLLYPESFLKSYFNPESATL